MTSIQSIQRMDLVRIVRKTAAYLWIAMWIPGCSSTVIKMEADYSLDAIRKAIVGSLTAGVQSADPSRRKFSSKPFRIMNTQTELPIREDDVRRQLAHVTIMGDRRPYSVQVVVETEERSGKDSEDWTKVGTDESRAKKIGLRIQEKLKTRREENVIDDFTPF